MLFRSVFTKFFQIFFHVLKTDEGTNLTRNGDLFCTLSTCSLSTWKSIFTKEKPRSPAGLFYLFRFSSYPLQRERPISVFKYRDARTILRFAFDGKVAGADHEIDVDHRIVDAEFFDLFVGIIFITLHAHGKAPAERKVATGVFV